MGEKIKLKGLMDVDKEDGKARISTCLAYMVKKKRKSRNRNTWHFKRIHERAKFEFPVSAFPELNHCKLLNFRIIY